MQFAAERSVSFSSLHASASLLRSISWWTLVPSSFLIDRVREEALPGVFTIEFSDGRIAKTIADATGCETWLLHSCHNVSREDFDAGVTYLQLMHRNLEFLKKAVN